MTKSKIKNQKSKINDGFTLLELIIVIAIISIMATLGIAAFVAYNRSQTLNSAALDLANMLQLAKSRAQSQVKPADTCTGTLNGYKVGLCGPSSLDCSGTDNDNGKKYALYIVCSNNSFIPVTSKKFSTTSIDIDTGATTTTSVLFRVLTGGVSGSGSIVLSGFGKTKTITVDASGNISSN